MDQLLEDLDIAINAISEFLEENPDEDGREEYLKCLWEIEQAKQRMNEIHFLVSEAAEELESEETAG